MRTADTTEVEKYVSAWATYTATATKMKAAGDQLMSAANDTYLV